MIFTTCDECGREVKVLTVETATGTVLGDVRRPVPTPHWELHPCGHHGRYTVRLVSLVPPGLLWFLADLAYRLAQHSVALFDWQMPRHADCALCDLALASAARLMAVSSS